MKFRKYLAVMLLALCACVLGLFAACAFGGGHEHSYGEWTDVVNTCSEHVQKRVCEDCGNEEIQEVDASGHTYGDWTDFVNTCEKHVQKRVCSKCETEQFQDIDSVGHDYGIWTDLINNCTQHVQKRVCYSCGNEQTKFLDASGHSYGDWTDLVNTCEKHIQNRVCSVCSNEETRELEAEGHKYGEWTDLVNTCEEHFQNRVCSVCSNKETRELEAEGHKYGAWADLINTCEKHVQNRVCSVCSNEETRELEAEGHKYGAWTDLVNTCEEHVQKRICSECGNEQTQELETEGHNYGEWTDLVNTCEEHVQIKVCKVCNDILKQDLEVKGHKFANGVCENCGVIESFALSRYNGTYGLNYFESNGFENECELYYRIDNAVRAFHVNGEDAENDGDGKFVFAEVEYADLDLTADRAVSVWKTYKDDNPLYYWFANSVSVNDVKLILLTEEEYSNGDKRSEYNNLVYAEVKKYAALTDKNDNAYRIALCYHDAIIEAVDYAYDGSGRPQSAAWAHNILGIIEKKGAVCESYARTFQLLLNYSGVENIFVTGDAGEAHAWNLVKLDDGNWYWCDLTWDDTPVKTIGLITSPWEWGISYNYFMVNDTQNVNWCDGGWVDEVNGEKSFTDLHTAASPNLQAQYFLYDLPERSQSVYTANATYLVRDTFDIGEITYAVTGYNTVQLTWAAAGLQGDLKIPERVTADDGNTYTVISLGGIRNGVFDDADILHWDLENVSIYIPATVRFIWGNSFYTRKVANFYVDKDNEWFTAVDGVLFTKSMKTLVAYNGASKRESYKIPDEVYQITSNAFIASNLKTLALGSGVRYTDAMCWGTYYDDTRNFVSGGGWQYILDCMADGATITVDNNPYYFLEDGIMYSGDGEYLEAVVEEMETIIIKERVTWICVPSYFYVYGRRHSRFVVEEGNEFFAAEDGVLYNKAKTKIICVLRYIEGEVRLADELKTIDFAFCFTDKITKISIGSNVEYIGEAFFNRIPNEIVFRGTIEQWLAIEKHEKWNRSPAVGFKITCTDGVLDVNGNVLETFQ